MTVLGSRRPCRRGSQRFGDCLSSSVVIFSLGNGKTFLEVSNSFPGKGDSLRYRCSFQPAPK
jgi:hypothetical protein